MKVRYYFIMTTWWQWFLSVIDLINKLLDQLWTTLGGEDLLFSEISDIFDTVHFTKSPEYIILVSTSSLDLEFGSEFLISWQPISHSIK